MSWNKKHLREAEKAFEAFWEQHFEKIFHPASELRQNAYQIAKASFLYGAEAGFNSSEKGKA